MSAAEQFPSPRQLVVSPSAAHRLETAATWLARCDRSAPLLIVGATTDGPDELVHRILAQPNAAIGWRRTTLPRLAAELSVPALSKAQKSPAGSLSLVALTARMIREHHTQGALERFAKVADRPGLPRTLFQTLQELRMAEVSVPAVGALTELADLQRAYEVAMDQSGLADRAFVFRSAAQLLQSHLVARDAGTRPPPTLAGPLLLLDVDVHTPAAMRLVRALAGLASKVLATIAAGDARSTQHLERSLGVQTVAVERGRMTSPVAQQLADVQDRLFSSAQETPSVTPASAPAADDPAVVILSAPGESRECVEIARHLRAEARSGRRLDRIAIVLHAPSHYRVHIESAMRRANLPAHFVSGSRRPDPAGRAMVALLHCARERLSARAFAEYLSLSQVPKLDDEGRPLASAAEPVRWVPPEDELLPGALGEAEQLPEAEPESQPPSADDQNPAGSLRVPRRWERLLVDAAVIGGRARWERRLSGYDAELCRELELSAEDEIRSAAIERTRSELRNLRAFALPVLDTLAALPDGGCWSEWIDALSRLAGQALIEPTRVRAVLAEMHPMGDLTSVTLAEVIQTLEPRLLELSVRPTGRRYGKVFIGPPNALRGMQFDVVAVVGLAERLFPQQIGEDPILLDSVRAELSTDLDTTEHKVRRERLALRLAVGAATSKLILSYPRIDIELGRPRVPSFYGLEVLRAQKGYLPSFGELARDAERVGAAALGWPAPRDPREAIDIAEYDLSVLRRIQADDDGASKGQARYLIEANEHLARALRGRYARYSARWTSSDGLLDTTIPGLLSAHQLSERSYSPTALEKFASCPYRFYLHAIHRLAPREIPEAVEKLNPRERGSLWHDVMFRLWSELRTRSLIPITNNNFQQVDAIASEVLKDIEHHYREVLAPAIDRVWQDGVEAVASDVREVLRLSIETQDWVPTHFELSFGLSQKRDNRDPASVDAPAEIMGRLKLRGSIDVVERGPIGGLRATDYKTGRPRLPRGGSRGAAHGLSIGGGETLQPVLYALALGPLISRDAPATGHLYFCTSTGGFTHQMVELDDVAHEGVEVLIDAVDQSLKQGFFPAAPRPANRGQRDGACTYCDYRVVCGPHEESRTQRKIRDKRMLPLVTLRERP